MRLDIIQIGNSKGLRIPKVILEQCGINNAVNLEVEDHSLVITPYKDPRKQWEKSFQAMSKNQDDQLLDDVSNFHLGDEEEWEW